MLAFGMVGTAGATSFVEEYSGFQALFENGSFTIVGYIRGIQIHIIE